MQSPQSDLTPWTLNSNIYPYSFDLHLAILTLNLSLSFAEWSYAVTGVEGNLIELPCNASTSKDGDDVKLVLWFKNGSDKPIYT